MPCCNPKTAEAAVPAYIAESVRDLLGHGGTGEILMVNSAGVYLSAEEHTVFLCDFSWGAVPTGIAVMCFREWVDALKPEAGQSFTFAENRLCFQAGELRLQPTEMPASESVSLEPQADRIAQAAADIEALHKEKGISMLALPLILGRDPSAVLSLNPYCTRAYPSFVRLICAMDESREGDIHDCVASLLGLGTGLTPSADDVMLGMLFAFRQLPHKSVHAVQTFRESIAALCDTHTNRISAAYLKAILRGERFARMEQVWRGICGVEPLETSALTQIGSNSGSEMLLGMLLAMRICGYRADVSRKQ